MSMTRSKEAAEQGICHTAEECAAFYSSLSEQIKAPALAALQEETKNYAADIREKFKADPENWYVEHHFWWGMGIRNFLREKGFGEEYFGSHNLDDIYIYLVEEALDLK